MPMTPPVPVDVMRSADHMLTIVNEYKKKQQFVGYWNDIRKCWMNRTTNKPVEHKIVNFEPLTDN